MSEFSPINSPQASPRSQASSGTYSHYQEIYHSAPQSPRSEAVYRSSFDHIDSVQIFELYLDKQKQRLIEESARFEKLVPELTISNFIAHLPTESNLLIHARDALFRTIEDHKRSEDQRRTEQFNDMIREYYKQNCNSSDLTRFGEIYNLLTQLLKKSDE